MFQQKKLEKMLDKKEPLNTMIMPKSFYYDFYYGRNSIYFLLEHLQIKEGDEILTPAWDCDEVLQPFRRKKCNLVFYKTDSLTFNVDLNDLERLVNPNIKLIHIINHFGFTQDWVKIKKNRLPLQYSNP